MVQDPVGMVDESVVRVVAGDCLVQVGGGGDLAGEVAVHEVAGR